MKTNSWYEIQLQNPTFLAFPFFPLLLLTLFRHCVTGVLGFFVFKTALFTLGVF